MAITAPRVWDSIPPRIGGDRIRRFSLSCSTPNFISAGAVSGVGISFKVRPGTKEQIPSYLLALSSLASVYLTLVGSFD